MNFVGAKSVSGRVDAYTIVVVGCATVTKVTVAGVIVVDMFGLARLVVVLLNWAKA